jgi:hypothetical protein
MRNIKLANPLKNHVVAGNLLRTRIFVSLVLACATCLHTLTFVTAAAQAQAIPINITIDESVEGQPPLVTADGLAAQVINVQTLSTESWQIDIMGGVSDAVGGFASFATFLQLSEPGFPEQVSDILTFTNFGTVPGDNRTVHFSFLLQSDEEGNPLRSVGVSQTEAASGNTITFGQFITGSSSGPTFPLNVMLISDVPEPSTGVLAVIACGMMWWWRKRFK